MRSSTAQILLRDSYETSCGIYDHKSSEGDHPLALVRMNWSEDTITNGRLHERMRKFALLGIGDIFKISFKEFVDSPTYVCELYTSVAEEEAIRKNAAITKEIAAVDEAMGRG